MALSALFNKGRRLVVQANRFGDIVPPFFGVVAHHYASGIQGLLEGHGPAFYEMTVMHGLPTTDYFTYSGITAKAEANGGLCSFRLGKNVALYQSRNEPIVDDDALTPSLDANRALFGSFMGTLLNTDARRAAKRRIVESTFGNAKWINGVTPDVRRLAHEYINNELGKEQPLDGFAINFVAYVDSFLPGLLDFRKKPLTYYLASDKYGRFAKEFFDIASEVISKANPAALQSAEELSCFVRSLILDNLESIVTAPPTNIIRQSFELWGISLEQKAIMSLDAEKVYELATLIVASYDTTSLSLLWAISYVEADSSVKHQLLTRTNLPGCPIISMAELIVLEAIRLGGSNPTALYRRVVKPFVLTRNGRSVTVPTGTMLWLDRRRANCDHSIFPKPCSFSIENIAALFRSERETVPSLLSRSRYEINSFSMINTERNPRKCPGRLLSVRLQAILLEELYGNYKVTTKEIDLKLRDFSSMPRPNKAGVIKILK